MSYLLKLVLKLLTVNSKILIATIEDLILRYTEVKSITRLDVAQYRAAGRFTGLTHAVHGSTFFDP